jgi:hypothetical protein
VRQSKAVVILQTWWRGVTSRLFVAKFKQALDTIRWAFAGFVLRWRFKRCSEATGTIRGFLTAMNGVSRQKYVVLRFRRHVQAAYKICKRWKMTLLRKEARSSLMATQLRTAELRLLVRYALTLSVTGLGTPTSRAVALAETLSKPAELKQLSDRLVQLRQDTPSDRGRSRLRVDMEGSVGPPSEAKASTNGDPAKRGLSVEIPEPGGAGTGLWSPSRAAATPSLSTKAVRAKQEHMQTLAFVETALAQTPQLPDEMLQDGAFRLARFLEGEHRDLVLHHERTMKALTPFFLRKRREAELSQRLNHVGSSAAFAFDPSLMKPGTYRWEAPRLKMRQDDDFMFTNIMRLRKAANKLRPDPGWLLGTASDEPRSQATQNRAASAFTF